MEEIKQAVTILNQGGIVIFPTDTAFGIGCRMDDEKAVERLFTIRKRPKSQATPVLVSSLEMAQKYVQPIPDIVVNKLIKHYWPGALTIILTSKRDSIPSLVRGGGETLGVRMPDHKETLALINKVGVPLLGPSANFHGEKTPYTVEDLNPELVKMVDFVIPGECSIRQASTVVDSTVRPWKILREGAVKIYE